MKREEADKIYNENWVKRVETISDATKVIKDMAQIGGYEVHLESSNIDNLVELGIILVSMGYEVSDYNGDESLILVSWG